MVMDTKMTAKPIKLTKAQKEALDDGEKTLRKFLEIATNEELPTTMCYIPAYTEASEYVDKVKGVSTVLGLAMMAQTLSELIVGVAKTVATKTERLLLLCPEGTIKSTFQAKVLKMHYTLVLCTLTVALHALCKCEHTLTSKIEGIEHEN